MIEIKRTPAVCRVPGCVGAQRQIPKRGAINIGYGKHVACAMDVIAKNDIGRGEPTKRSIERVVYRDRITIVICPTGPSTIVNNCAGAILGNRRVGSV